jgi:hypothetical protein
MYALQKLLWDMRHDADVVGRFRSDPVSLFDSYGVEAAEREALQSLDFKSLYDRGANPYLLYFCALQIGVPRQEYYARIRGEQP